LRPQRDLAVPRVVGPNTFVPSRPSTLDDVSARLEEALAKLAERERQLEELARVEVRLLQAQAVARVGNWELDSATGAMWASDEARRLYGLANDAPVSLALVQTCVVEADRPRLDAALAGLLAGGDYDQEFSIQPLDGSPVRVIHSVASLERDANGAPVRAAGVVQDVTDRKRAEETSRKLTQAVEQAHASVVITDVRGVIEYVNPRFTAVTGYAREEVVGKNPRLLKSGDKTTADYAAMWNAITAGNAWRGEFRNRKKSGELYWERAVISPILDASGTITHFVSVKDDVTEHRTLEERLRHAQKMEAVGLLAGGIAHDFNNVLSVILSYASLASEALPEGDPLRADLDEIVKAGGRAADLTRQLLSFSRRQVLQPRVLDLNEVLHGIEKMLGRLVGEDVELVLRRGERLHSVHADPGQLEQVVMNLAVNARDAMPEGGRLTVETANIDLSLDVAHALLGKRLGRHVVLTVGDSGIGMDAATRERIFEPFFTTKEAGRGTGLGLATVFGIVEQSGGAITVDSAPGVGTTFRVYLPACDVVAEHAAPSALPSLAPAPSAGLTVLLAEDEPQLRDLLTRTLRRAGYAVIAAASSAEALVKSAGHTGAIHVLLTDVVLPGMNGRQLAEQLVATRPDARVLYMSGYVGARAGPHGVLADGVAFLPKPFTPAVMLAKLRDVIEGKA
jgi:PAS domain S-box-containing protein